MEEQVLWVDEQDRPLGHVPRSQMRKEALGHRATYIFVFNAEGKVCVQRRTLTKDYCPGWLDLAAGGVVTAEETDYETSARRELYEELGITGVPLRAYGTFYHESPTNRVWGGLFSCEWNGKIIPQPSEVEAIFWMSPEEMEARHAEATPSSVYAWHLLKQRVGILR